jgi:hypothetical protein
MGTVIIDRFHQLPFRTGVGGAGNQGKQSEQAQRSEAQGEGGLAHGADSSDEMTTIEGGIGADLRLAP